MSFSPSPKDGLHERGERVRFAGDTVLDASENNGSRPNSATDRHSVDEHDGSRHQRPSKMSETPNTPKTARRHAVYAVSSMILLTLQGTAMSIILRYSRIREGRAYAPSVSGQSFDPTHLHLLFGT